jgi:signal transduction histidine kinase
METLRSMSARIPRPGPQPQRAIAQLLDVLSERLRQGRSNELYVLCAKLESLRHRLGELPADDQQRLEKIAQPMRPALALLIESARCGELADPIALRDLRTMLRSLRCTVDRLDDSARPDVHYARVDLAQLMRGCHAAFAGIADERDVRFDADVPQRLIAELDVEKIQGIAVNLLFNAFKHTPVHGHIRLALRQDVAADEIIIAVSDGGPSLAPSRAQAIFRRPRAGDHAASVAQALGLCLFNSRDFAVLHGGSLRVQNNDDVGVLFELRLPRHAPRGMRVARRAMIVGDFASRVVELARTELRAEAELGAPAEYPGDDRPLLLIVEDTRSLHRLFADCFEHEYRVASAFDGIEGLAAAETLRPDLILTDLILPRLDGRSMVRALRARPAFAEIPIVVLTTKENPEQELELLDQGVQDVIHKPFLLPEVQARVRNLMSSKRARDVLSDLVDRHQTDLIHLADTVARQQHELQLALDQVETARSMAEGASRVKSNFLRVMSHELKTPVTAMHLQLRILERDPEFGADPRLQEALARIWRSSRKLLCLVDTMLEWARVESGRCRVYAERFDLASLVHDVTCELSSFARQKNIELAVHVADNVQPDVISDRRILELVLTNMIARAIQLTRAGTVEVVIQQSGELRRISVKDLGAVSIEDRRELFEPISATKDLRWSGGAGSGMGLQVVRDIARAIDAEIVLEQTPGPGTTLTIELPGLALEAPAALPATSRGGATA